jgi:hypothetical protein
MTRMAQRTERLLASVIAPTCPTLRSSLCVNQYHQFFQSPRNELRTNQSYVVHASQTCGKRLAVPSGEEFKTKASLYGIFDKRLLDISD